MTTETFLCHKCGSEHYWRDGRQHLGSTVHGLRVKRYIKKWGETDCNTCGARYQEGLGWFPNFHLGYKDLVALVNEGLMSVDKSDPVDKPQKVTNSVDLDKMKREGYIKELRSAINRSKSELSSNLWSNTITNGEYDFKKMGEVVEFARDHLMRIELILKELKNLGVGVGSK